ncbi:MAG: glycosyltransferase family 39 protein, partial [Myxococcota bacterium]
YAPHPPGYPVLMGIAKAFFAIFGGEPHRAVAVASVIGVGLATASVYQIGKRLFDERVAHVVILLSLASPLIAIFASRPLSDMLGTGLGLAAVACAVEAIASLSADEARAKRFAAGCGVMVALTLGTRLSAVPVTAAAGLSLLAHAPLRFVALGGGVGGLLAWALPFFAWVSPVEVTTSMSRHAAGHFNHHGGSVLTVSDPMERTVAFVRALWAHGFGGPWSDRPRSTLAVGAGLGVLLAAAVPEKKIEPSAIPLRRMVMACWLIHFAWVMLAQNIIWQPRHTMPLVWLALPWVAQRAIALWDRAAAATRFTGLDVRVVLLVALVMGVYESRRLAAIQRESAPAPVRIAEYIAERAKKEKVIVATTQLRGWLSYRMPGVDVRRVKSLKETRSWRDEDATLLVTSEVPGARRAGTEVARADAEPFVSYVLYRMRVHERPRLKRKRPQKKSGDR